MDIRRTITAGLAAVAVLAFSAPVMAQFVADKSDPLGSSSFSSTAPNDAGYVSMWTDDGGLTHEFPDQTPGGVYTTN
ncbi:MAG TPA: hypothetical protein VF175_14215, partial [Lacipirellula sp.]